MNLDGSVEELVKPITRRTSKKRKHGIAIEDTLANTGNRKSPNMSRKNQGTKIYSFPVFDKCDSLVFFPATFTSMLNSGDFMNFRRLMKTRFDKDCIVSFCSSGQTNIAQFVKRFECINEISPDSVQCVHTTTVVRNQIRSVIYFKMTESKTLREAVERSYPDRDVLKMCLTPAENTTKLLSFLESKSDKVRKRISKIVHEADEMLVYGRTFMTLTFDKSTKSVTRLDFDGEFTSIQLVGDKPSK